MAKNWPRSGYVVLGVVAGAAAMAAMLSMPMVDPPGAAPLAQIDDSGRSVETFRVSAQDILAVTHDGGGATPLFPQAIQQIKDPALSGSEVVTMKVRNAQGTIIGVGARYVAIGHDPAARDTYWTLVLTLRGTLAAHCAPSAPDQCGAVVGGTDEFAAFRGRMMETSENGGYRLVLTSEGRME